MTQTHKVYTHMLPDIVWN